MADAVILSLDRPKVEAMRLQEPLTALERMIETPRSAREYAGKVTIAFGGFQDETEVYLIRSVQRFVRDLTERFPYWLHFANKDDDTLFVLMACLVPPEPLAGARTPAQAGEGADGPRRREMERRSYCGFSAS